MIAGGDRAPQVSHLAAAPVGAAYPAKSGGSFAARPGAGADVNAEGASALLCSAGIMAYNEEANIGNAILAILSRRLTVARLAELIVVASGCTDRTVEIVESIAHEDPRLRLVVQEKRLGKASAVNVFVREASAPVLLMASADVLVQDGTIDAMLRHFQDPTVGMVGGHPIPVNDEATFLGHAVHLQWRLHDRVARRRPKLGEIVAFRNVVPGIPMETAVDEISIQALVSQLGYRLVYEPAAVVYNRGASTVGDFLRQRRRIYTGHLSVRRQQGYEASTMSGLRILRSLAGSGAFATPRTALWTAGAIGLEALARGLGRYDLMRRHSHQIWDTALTTKQEISDADHCPNQSVLVFNLVNLNRIRLEYGARLSRQLIDKVTRHIIQALGPRVSVSAAQGGTIVVLLQRDRDDAERVAERLIGELSQTRFISHQRDIVLNVACGIIAFSQTNQTQADSIGGSVPASIEQAIA